MSLPTTPGGPLHDPQMFDSRFGAIAPPMRTSFGPPRSGGLGSEPEQAGPGITPAFVMRAVRRWWKVATPIALMMAAVAAAVLYKLHVPLYVATAWLRIEDQTPYIVYPAERGRQFEVFAESQTSIIRSPLVLERVIGQPDIARYEELQEVVNLISHLGSSLSVGRVGRSELFTVSFSGPDPKHTQRIANAVVEAYFKQQATDEASRTQKILELLEEERQRRQTVIAKLQDNYEVLVRTKSSDNPLAEFQHLLRTDEKTIRHPVEQLYHRITDSELKRELLEATLNLDEDLKENFTMTQDDLIKSVEGDPRLAPTKEQIAKRLQRMEAIAATSSLGKQDPAYLALNNEVEELNAGLQQTMKQLVPEVAGRIREDRTGGVSERITRAKAQIANHRLMETLLKAKMFAQIRDRRLDDKKGVEVAFLAADLEREKRVNSLIAERVARMRTEIRAPARVTNLKDADLPPGPVNQREWKKITLAGLAAFLVPFGLAVIWERIVHRVDGPQQLWQADLNVIGEVARLPVSSRVSSLTASRSVARDVSLFEESIDSLRTCLVLSEPTSESRVLVVSSAVSGEGKTSVASQLAVSIARSTGEPTLLIDADMRSPDLHNVFDIPNEPGLAQVLSHECTAEEAIVTSWSNYVHLLPAGVLKASPHKLLGDGALKLFLSEVRSTYRHIIIDTSPILSASESLVLAKAADGTLLCAMRDISRVDQVQKAYERLVNTGARPLGTVLNGVPTSRYAYLYGTYAYPRDL